MESKKDINSAAKSNQLDFLYDLYTQDIEIGEDNKALLIKHGYIKTEDFPKKVTEKYIATKIHNDPFYIDGPPSEVDRKVDVVSGDKNVPENGSVFTESEYKKLVEENGSVIYSGTNINIKQSDWMPKSVTDHSKEFIEWIDSISFAGFANRVNYRKFNLYCQQAYQWLAENDTLANYGTHESREKYKDTEIERCAENTLYFLNKYLQLKESTLVAGMRQYVASKAHEIIIYLFDCGYSFYLGKPRQIAATSTLGGCALKRTVFRRNHFIKFITENDSKGQEIFEDKIKYPFAELPNWMRDDSRNDSGKTFALGHKEKKGDRSGTNSNILVAAPTPTAISGGTPQLALIDEAGNIPILTEIIKDARPTSFWMNPVTGKIELKRQIVVWGTGGDMEKGGKAFEREFMTCLEDWKTRNFISGIVPIFFDWTTRMGITKEFYEKEKAYAYSVKGPKSDESKILFRQQYPSCVEDMFLTSTKTLVSQDYIVDQVDRIVKAKFAMKYQYGYFEPIFGEEEQPEGSDIPFNIIGANFVPLEDGDGRISTMIFQHPKPGWRNRYYSGTDPIASDTGLSNMASAIWDKYYNTVSAVVNFRSNNYKEVYLQTMLLGIYYDLEHQMGVKELLEANIGLAYREYKDSRGRFDTLVFNSELPDILQTGSGNLIGIDNKGIRNKVIIDTLYSLILAFGTKIYIEDFFLQLKTFVSTATAKGNETWGPADRKHYKDDILFAVTYAYICAHQCFPEELPYNAEEEKKGGTKMISKLAYDKDYNLIRVYEKVKY